LPLADGLATGLVENDLDVLVGDVFAVAGFDVLATLDGDLTAVDFGNEDRVVFAGVLFLITTFFLLQHKSISQDNTVNLNTETYTAPSKTCCLYILSASTRSQIRRIKLPSFFNRTRRQGSSTIK
jgi:hypothetical protein